MATQIKQLRGPLGGTGDTQNDGTHVDCDFPSRLPISHNQLDNV